MLLAFSQESSADSTPLPIASSHRLVSKAAISNLICEPYAVTPEIKQALAEAARLRAECETAMLQHFYEVSRTMPSEQGKRYLAWVQQETLLPGRMVPTSPSTRMQK